MSLVCIHGEYRSRCGTCAEEALDNAPGMLASESPYVESPIRAEFMRVLDMIEATGQREAICVCGHSVFQHADGQGLTECFTKDCGCLSCRDSTGADIHRS